MSSDDPTMYAVLGFGAGIYWFLKGFRVYRKYRVLADTPAIPIRSIAMGLVEIHGSAQGEETIYSPVTYTPCYFYKVEIEKWVKDSKGRGSWKHHATDQKGLRFYLQDQSGKVLVDAAGAELDLNQNVRREVGSGFGRGFTSLFGSRQKTDPRTGIGPSEDDLLEYVGKAASGLAIPKLVSNLAPGESDPEVTRTQAQRELEIMRQLRGQKSQGTGALGALGGVLRGGISLGRGSSWEGQYRLTEYCIVPGFQYDITGSCVENPQPRDTNDRNLIVKGENEPTFLISWRSEKELEGSLRSRAMLHVFGGGALSVACLAFLLVKLGWL